MGCPSETATRHINVIGAIVRPARFVDGREGNQLRHVYRSAALFFTTLHNHMARFQAVHHREGAPAELYRGQLGEV